MSTLLDSPEYTANEIYEIQQIDPVEGAATGATFGGIGVSNQPHQQLANRTSYLKNRQDTNVANVAALQAFMSGFTGSLQQNGYLKIPIIDALRGDATAIVQWGLYSLPTTILTSDQQYTLYWPIPFPNAVLVALATDSYWKNGVGNLVAAVVSLTNTYGTFVLDVPSSTEYSNGFYWLAIGF